MQVFIPYPDFQESIACLDYRRLGKQRVECGQILTAISYSIRPHETSSKPAKVAGWVNHPATRMWRGHESALAVYMSMCIAEWIARGYVNNMVPPYVPETFHLNPGWAYLPELSPDARDAVLPEWWGREDVHSSHRARLLDKDADHYGQFGWTEAPRSEEEGYVWPC